MLVERDLVLLNLHLFRLKDRIFMLCSLLIDGNQILEVIIGNDPNDVGEYFIDRDATHFARILTFLRTGKLKTDEMTKNQIEELEEELDYYQLHQSEEERLARYWSWDPHTKGQGVELSSDYQIAKRNGGANILQSLEIKQWNHSMSNC